MADDYTVFRDYNQKQYGLDSLFVNIAIETNSFCNRGCDFCPVGHARRPVKQMPEAMFENILQQLVTLQYVGNICLHWYNEPLADKRIVAWIAKARLACPQSLIYFASNGDLLTPKLLDAVVDAGLDLMRISQYDGAIQPNMQAILDAGQHLKHMHVSVKTEPDLWNSRGGSLPKLVVLQEPMKERCIRPDEQLVIDARGEVPLCVNDYFGSYRIGNVEQTSLVDLWNHPALVQAREYLRQADHTQIAVCRACNEPMRPYAGFLPKGRKPINPAGGKSTTTKRTVQMPGGQKIVYSRTVYKQPRKK